MNNVDKEEEGQSIPVFNEALWECYTIEIDFVGVHPNIYDSISSLPIKAGKPIKMLDRYLCKVGCDVNIKLRDKDLKIKFLH